MLNTLVPPTIVPAKGQNSVAGLRNTNVTIGFTITDSDPLVKIENIVWFATNASTTRIISENAAGDQLIISPDRRSLTILNIQLYNKGSYTLVATNEAGTRNNTIYVDVHGNNICHTLLFIILYVHSNNLYLKLLLLNCY